jgi:ABC-type multidrug transport system permease subunit
MQLAMRNRAFLFFSLVMPLAFLFIAMGIFARGLENATSYILGPVLAITVMGSFWGLSVQLVTFREQGILRRFRLAPIGPGAMLASSILSNYFLTLPTVILEFALARWLFHLQNWGNFWAVLALVTLGTVTFAALGLTVASVTNTMQETQIINNLIWTAFLFLTGATVPLPKLPLWVQKVALFLPPTYLVEGLQRALTSKATLWDVRAELLALAGGTIFSFWVSRQLFRWEPEQKVSRRAKAWAVSTIVPFLLLGAWEYSNGQLLRNSHLALDTVRDAQVPPSGTR